jgi:hypothetical protein
MVIYMVFLVSKIVFYTWLVLHLHKIGLTNIFPASYACSFQAQKHTGFQAFEILRKHVPLVEKPVHCAQPLCDCCPLWVGGDLGATARALSAVQNDVYTTGVMM